MSHIFKNSLKRLDLQYQNYRALDPSLAPLMKEAVVESVFYRFKSSYGELCTSLGCYMKNELGLKDIPNSPTPMFRLANENGLLSSPLERWREYEDASLFTPYSETSKAHNMLRMLRLFIFDANNLYKTMSDNEHTN